MSRTVRPCYQIVLNGEKGRLFSTLAAARRYAKREQKRLGGVVAIVRYDRPTEMGVMIEAIA